jgi:glycosyltransferase involved in cell wall biosynthesis
VITKRIKKLIRKGLRQVHHWVWIANGHFGRNISINTPDKLTVIIPSYNIERVGNITPQVHSILKCDFVENIIVSNHNPQLILEDWVEINDERLKLINQQTHRGCGYGWIVGINTKSEFIIVIDDDLLIFPKQLAFLFMQLIEQPEIPHGLIGSFNSKYYLNHDMEVDNLYEIYAVTQIHLKKYLELVQKITTQGYTSHESIEFWGDDIIISNTGEGKPRIHDAGHLLRCPTATQPGVATYLKDDFQPKRAEVRNALERVLSN